MLWHKAQGAGGIDGTSPIEMTVTRTDSASDLTLSTSTTFSSVSIGTAASDRAVVFAYACTNTNNAVSSCVIGGVTATEVFEQSQSGGTGPIRCGIFLAEVPTGTTADIDLTVGDSGQIGYAVFRVVGDGSRYPSVRLSGGGGSSGTQSFSLSLLETDAVIAVQSVRAISTNSITWDGASTVTNVATDPIALSRYGGAGHMSLSGDEASNLNFNTDGSDNHAYCYGVFE